MFGVVAKDGGVRTRRFNDFRGQKPLGGIAVTQGRQDRRQFGVRLGTLSQGLIEQLLEPGYLGKRTTPVASWVGLKGSHLSPQRRIRPPSPSLDRSSILT